MAPRKEDKKKRKNKRKSRTEVSSPSSSDSEGEPQRQTPTATQQEQEESDVEDAKVNETIVVPQQRKADPERAFEEFYLRQATKEFANDLDKLRSAGDFNEKSVSMLVRALKQGTSCFSKEERQRIGSALAE